MGFSAPFSDLAFHPSDNLGRTDGLAEFLAFHLPEVAFQEAPELGGVHFVVNNLIVHDCAPCPHSGRETLKVLVDDTGLIGRGESFGLAEARLVRFDAHAEGLDVAAFKPLNMILVVFEAVVHSDRPFNDVSGIAIDQTLNAIHIAPARALATSERRGKQRCSVLFHNNTSFWGRAPLCSMSLLYAPPTLLSMLFGKILFVKMHNFFI